MVLIFGLLDSSFSKELHRSYHFAFEHIKIKIRKKKPLKFFGLVVKTL